MNSPRLVRSVRSRRSLSSSSLLRLAIAIIFAVVGCAVAVDAAAGQEDDESVPPKETCASSSDGGSGNGSTTEESPGTQKSVNDDYYEPSLDEVRKMSDFIVPTLKPGELQLLRWKDTRGPVQDYAGHIGLPPRTARTLRKYASDLGMFDIVREVHYESPCEHDDGRFFTTPGVYSGGTKELKWFAQRPSSQYVSDLHWYGCADERTHESFLRALAESDFDLVVKAIGERYGLDGLAVQGVGFLGATHATDGFIHYDWSDVGGRAFNVLVPLEQIPGAGPELYLEDDERTGEIKLHPDYGLLLGEDTLHGTHDCDHRHSGRVRTSVTVYLADVTRGNLETVADDPTSMFPLPGATEWLWTQRGRHWGEEGRSMAGDLGRKPFTPRDKLAACEKIAREGKCDEDGNWRELHHWRENCPLSCGVYVSDEEYKPGKPRKDIFY